MNALVRFVVCASVASLLLALLGAASPDWLMDLVRDTEELVENGELPKTTREKREALDRQTQLRKRHINAQLCLASDLATNRVTLGQAVVRLRTFSGYSKTFWENLSRNYPGKTTDESLA